MKGLFIAVLFVLLVSAPFALAADEGAEGEHHHIDSAVEHHHVDSVTEHSHIDGVVACVNQC